MTRSGTCWEPKPAVGAASPPAPVTEVGAAPASPPALKPETKPAVSATPAPKPALTAKPKLDPTVVDAECRMTRAGTCWGQPKQPRVVKTAPGAKP